MSNTILKAKQFVKQKFAQSNNHCGHSFQVYEILKDEFLVNDEEILIAGLLHDVLEDTDTSKAELEEEFSPKVVDLVESVSHPKNYTQEQRGEYYKKIFSVSDEAKVIKLADFLDVLRWMIKIYQDNKQHEYPKFKDNDKYINVIRRFLAVYENNKYRQKVLNAVNELEKCIDGNE